MADPAEQTEQDPKQAPDLTEEQLAQIPDAVKNSINRIFDRYSKAETDEERDAIKKEVVVEMGKTFASGYQLGHQDMATAVKSKIYVPNRAARRAHRHE
jgi:hypothetical protein